MAVSRNQKKTQARKRSGSAPKARGSARRRSGGGRRLWLVVPLALGLAGIAVYFVVAGGGRTLFEADEPPMDDIGDASRLRIENLLREAEDDRAGAR